MAPPRLILVGGFLGAGKTTLLSAAAERLERRGLTVGLITNDQAEDLVDTQTLERQGLAVREVSGGCFCCRFGCLLSASDLLADEADPDVLLAEPVGSCTDISATVIQPLKSHYGRRFRVAPFTVLVDPDRLRSADPDGEGDPLGKNVGYIFRTQLAEADLIVLNKVDLLSPEQLAEAKARLRTMLPDTPVLTASASTGEGVDEWLEVVTGQDQAGTRIAEVDYNTYAAGEAELGWLNATVRLRGPDGADWRGFCAALLAAVQSACRERSAEIAHVKLSLDCDAGSITGNLTDTNGEPALRGDLSVRDDEADLTFNARVSTRPQELREIFDDCLAAAAGETIQAELIRADSLSPARPKPTHRFSAVVPPGGPTWRLWTRRGVTAALLALVLLASMTLVLQAAGVWPAPDHGGDGAGVIAPLPDGVTVLVLQMGSACASCRKIKAYLQQTLEADFSGPLRGGQLALRSGDYLQPANRHLARRYELVTTTVVLVERRGGAEVRSRKLDRVWKLLNDEAAFRTYVRDEVRRFTEGGD